MPVFAFDNSYARRLEGFYVPWEGAKFPSATMVRLNRDLAVELGLDPAVLDGPDGAAWLSGHTAPEGAVPLAMAYAGHQFGGFSPQLGDGRALLLGELIDRNSQRRDLHLKGSGRTPFSRGGDGKAVLGPVLREYLVGEAMHALGIPTTRALAAITTGEAVLRDSGPKPGAVLARVAASHLRIGTFQFFAARGEAERLRQLADYAIARHDPDLVDHDERYLQHLDRVIGRQADLIARWMHVGFIHGVMNTDNMTISGETIDYGPCAFMEAYDPATVFSSIDQHGRYAYGNQPGIAQWNLARFAETLLGLIDPDQDRAIERAEAVLNTFTERYQSAWLRGMHAKLGLSEHAADDADLAMALLRLMHENAADFTLSFRALADDLRGRPGALRALFRDGAGLADWRGRYHARLSRQPRTLAETAEAMDEVNPLYVPRNLKVEAALQAAEEGDLAPFERLLQVVCHPYVSRPEWADYTAPAPEGSPPYRTFCGT